MRLRSSTPVIVDDGVLARTTWLSRTAPLAIEIAIAIEIAACGRLEYRQVVADASIHDAPSDARAPDAGRGCPLIPGGTWGFVSTPLPILSTTLNEAGPFLSADMRTLYFTRGVYVVGPRELLVARRTDLASPFGAPMTASEDVAGRDEGAFAIAPDGLSMFLSASDATSAGDDLYVSTRASLAAPFGPWALLAALSTPGDDWDPFPAADGSLYFSTTSTDGEGDLVRSVRDASGALQPATLLTELATPEAAGNPSLTSDGLAIVFNTGTDIFYAVRPSIADPFGPRQLIPGIDTAAYEGEPFLRGDGCELFFARASGSDAGDWDLHVAHYVHPL
jgi:hypothetical protein